MKIETIHINACGEVTNPITAQGIRVTDDEGNALEVRQSAYGVVHVITGGRSYTLEYLKFRKDASAIGETR